MLALSENPPIAWPADAALEEPRGGRAQGAAAGQWWVAHTKARFEKAFAFDLVARRVPYFLPMIERVRVSGGRKRRAMMPLFGGYVFFCGTRDARYQALATDRLCQVIEVADQARLVRELSALRKALAGAARLDPHPFAVVGRRCRVTAGPFQGVEGVVLQHDAGSRGARLVLEVGILGQGAVMEIDADLLEPAGDDAGAESQARARRVRPVQAEGRRWEQSYSGRS